MAVACIDGSMLIRAINELSRFESNSASWAASCPMTNRPDIARPAAIQSGATRSRLSVDSKPPDGDAVQQQISTEKTEAPDG